MLKQQSMKFASEHSRFTLPPRTPSERLSYSLHSSISNNRSAPTQSYLRGKKATAEKGFRVHAKRYLETYLPNSGFEFAVTNRYRRSLKAIPNAASMYDASDFAESSQSGASRNQSRVAKGKGKANTADTSAGLRRDLCVVATRSFRQGEIVLCKGGFKNLSDEEDRQLRNMAADNHASYLAHEDNGTAPKDFSIIRSESRKCTQVLVGPARFVNHDCDPNVEFHKTRKHMLFRVIKPIRPNEELLVFYGQHYFGLNNIECMCATCERQAKGAFASKPSTLSSTATSSTSNGKPNTWRLPDDIHATTDEAISSATDGPIASTPPSPGAADAPTPPSKSASAEPDTRRAPSERIKTASSRSSPTANGAGKPAPSRNESALLKALSGHSGEDRHTFARSEQPDKGPGPDHFPSDREMLDPEQVKAKLTRCQTCSSPFLSAEYYSEQECNRCERHYTIFQADYPNRVPTDNGWKEKYQAHQAKKASEGKEGITAVKSGANKRKARDSLPDDEDETQNARSKKKGKGRDTTNGVKKRQGKDSSGRGSSRSRSTSMSRTPSGHSAASSSRLALVNQDGSPLSSAPTTPVRLTPLRSAGPGQDSSRQKDGSMPVKQRRASRHDVSKMDTDEDLVDQALRSTSAQSVDSELTEPPMQSDADASSVGTSAGDKDRAVSTSSDERPLGPKMLGKHADQMTMSKYWGAEEGSGPRVRRPPAKGPVSLANTVTPPSHKGKLSGHRRTASATSLRQREESVADDPANLPGPSTKRLQRSRDAQSATRSPSKISAAKVAADVREGESGPSSSAPDSKMKTEANSPSEAIKPHVDVPNPPDASPASLVPEPTPSNEHSRSTDNLRKSWGAPVGSTRLRIRVGPDAGGSRRDQPRRSSGSTGRSSDSEDGGSNTSALARNRTDKSMAGPAGNKPTNGSGLRQVSASGSASRQDDATSSQLIPSVGSPDGARTSNGGLRGAGSTSSPVSSLGHARTGSGSPTLSVVNGSSTTLPSGGISNGNTSMTSTSTDRFTSVPGRKNLRKRVVSSSRPLAAVTGSPANGSSTTGLTGGAVVPPSAVVTSTGAQWPSVDSQPSGSRIKSEDVSGSDALSGQGAAGSSSASAGVSGLQQPSLAAASDALRAQGNGASLGARVDNSGTGSTSHNGIGSVKVEHDEKLVWPKSEEETPLNGSG